jgi:hypothetical protein
MSEDLTDAPLAAGCRLAEQDMQRWLDHAIRRHDQEGHDGTRLAIRDPGVRNAKRARLVEMRDRLGGKP